MEDKLNKLLDLLIKGLETGVNLASEQVGPLLKELVTVYIIQEIPVTSVLALVFGVILIKVLKFEHEEVNLGAKIVISVLMLISTAFLVEGVKNVASAVYAPKATAIKIIKDLVKTENPSGE